MTKKTMATQPHPPATQTQLGVEPVARGATDSAGDEGKGPDSVASK